MLVNTNSNQWIANLYYSNYISLGMQYGLLGLLFLTVLGSIAMPLQRAMPYMKFVAFCFSMIVLTSLIGVIYIMVNTGFLPPEVRFVQTDPDNPNVREPIKTGETYF